MSAAVKGHYPCVLCLLLAKANPEVQSDNGHTALYYAVDNNHKKVAQLIRQHKRMWAMNSPAPLPSEIAQAAEQGEVRNVVDWLDEGGLVDAVGPVSTAAGSEEDWVTLLHTAASANQPKMVQMLLTRGASVDLKTSSGLTALMFALMQRGNEAKVAGTGHYACVGLLLRAKANPELQSETGYTALRFAEEYSHKDIVELILQYASPETQAEVAEAKAEVARHGWLQSVEAHAKAGAEAEAEAEGMKAKAAEVTQLAAEMKSAEAENTCLAVAAAMAVVGAVWAFARWRQP